MKVFIKFDKRNINWDCKPHWLNRDIEWSSVIPLLYCTDYIKILYKCLHIIIYKSFVVPITYLRENVENGSIITPVLSSCVVGLSLIVVFRDVFDTNHVIHDTKRNTRIPIIITTGFLRRKLRTIWWRYIMSENK